MLKTSRESYLNQDTGLVVRVGGEGLALFCGDSGIPLDESGHDTAGGLDTHRQRGDVEEKQVLDLFGFVAAKDGGLDGGAISDGFVRVDRLVQFFAVEEILRSREDSE